MCAGVVGVCVRVVCVLSLCSFGTRLHAGHVLYFWYVHYVLVFCVCVGMFGSLCMSVMLIVLMISGMCVYC